VSAEPAVLIVEDEMIAALYLKRLLAGRYRVVGIVRSGEEAVESATRESPDFVLMDIRLAGEIDGVEAARRILERGHPVVIFCSAYAREEIGDPVGRGLGTAHVAKPVRKEELLAALAAGVSGGRIGIDGEGPGPAR